MMNILLEIYKSLPELNLTRIESYVGSTLHNEKTTEYYKHTLNPKKWLAFFRGVLNVFRTIKHLFNLNNKSN